MALAYLEIDLRLTPIDPWRDVMAAQMGLLGFEAFVDSPFGFMAYIPQKDFKEKEFLQIELFEIHGLQIEWHTKVITPKNWNRRWEENFLPVRIGERCVVRANFHPPEKADYELVITPKMSFGTGHHETTQMMICFLLDFNFTDKRVLDMGAGTGVLSILAEKRGARSILALDNNPWCVENTNENIGFNHCTKITTKLNDSVPHKNQFDIILANISRNLLLQQIPDYAKILVHSGDLLISGFYVEDMGIIQNACEAEGFRFIRNFKKNKWVAAYFTKNEY